MATTADGSTMEFAIVAIENGVFVGEFSMDSTTEAHKDEDGVFEGTIKNGRLTATGLGDNGVSFYFAQVGKKGDDIQMTRSDMPGEILTFRAVSHIETAARGEQRFYYKTYATDLTTRAIINTTPIDTNPGSLRYRVALGSDVGILALHSDGVGSLTFFFGLQATATFKFTGVKLADFGSKEFSSTSGQGTFFSPIDRATYGYAAGKIHIFTQ